MSTLRPPPHAFLGVPVCDDLARLDAEFAVVGIPYGVPYGMSGVHSDAANAPTALRERSQRFAGQRTHYDFELGGTLFADSGTRLVDCGDLQGDPRDLEANAAAATATVTAILDAGAVPVVLGGDDSIPPLVVRAFTGRGRLNVVQIDAHLDYRDEVSGIRDGYSSTMRRIREMPFVGQIVQVGMRGVGSARPEDVAAAGTAGNVIIPAAAIHAHGIAQVLDAIESEARCLITLDVDGLDPSIAPGTSVPLPGGLTYSQASELFRGLAARTRLAGVCVVEHHPSLDVRDLTSVTITRLLVNLLGVTARRLSARSPTAPGAPSSSLKDPAGVVSIPAEPPSSSRST